MKEIKLTIDGKEVELTDEQLKALGIEVETKRNNPFERVEPYDAYYYVASNGVIDTYTNANDAIDGEMYDIINYFNDEAFAKQVALRQLLYRKLLKFAYDNECEDTKEWDGENRHWCIVKRYDHCDNAFDVIWYYTSQFLTVYFSSKDGAVRAIEEVVLPFMKEHPEFVW